MQSRSILLFCSLAVACVFALHARPTAAIEPVAVAVADFDYIDPSGGVMEPERLATERLRALVQQVREGLDQSGRYRVVTLECEPAPCSAGRTDPAELIAKAQAAGARLLVFGGIQKMNTVIQYGNDKYAESLATMDRFLAETKSDKPEHQSFRAGLLASLDRNDEASAIYKELVAKNPSDKRILMNAVAALQNADKFDQANILLEDAYKRGMLSESRELRALYVGYMNASRWNDAQKVIEDGVSKGILQSGPDLARDYQVLAQNAYVDDKIALAIELYGKAAPMAADGEAYLNLAKVLEYSGKKAQAKEAAQKALDKGVKKPDEARGILSR